MVDIISKRESPSPVEDFEWRQESKGVQRYRFGCGWFGRLIHCLGSGSFETTIEQNKKRWINKGSLARYICDAYCKGETPEKKKKVQEAINAVLKESPASLNDVIRSVLQKLVSKEIMSVLNLKGKTVKDVDTKDDYERVSSIFQAVRGGEQSGPGLRTDIVDKIYCATITGANTFLTQTLKDLQKIEKLPNGLRRLVIHNSDPPFNTYVAFVAELNKRAGTNLPATLSNREAVVKAARKFAELTHQYAKGVQECEARLAEAKTLLDFLGSTNQEVMDFAEFVKGAKAAEGKVLEDSVLQDITQRCDKFDEVLKQLRAESQKRKDSLQQEAEKLYGELQQLEIDQAAIDILRQKVSQADTVEKLKEVGDLLRDISEKRGRLAAMQSQLDSIASANIRDQVRLDYNKGRDVVRQLTTALGNALQHLDDYQRTTCIFDGPPLEGKWASALDNLQKAVYLVGAKSVLVELQSVPFEVRSLQAILGEQQGGSSERYDRFIAQLGSLLAISGLSKSPSPSQIRELLDDRLRVSGLGGKTYQERLSSWSEWLRKSTQALQPSAQGQLQIFSQAAEGFEEKRQRLLVGITTLVPTSKLQDDVRNFEENRKKLEALSQQYQTAQTRFQSIQKQYLKVLGTAGDSLVQDVGRQEAIIARLPYSDTTTTLEGAIQKYQRLIDALEAAGTKMREDQDKSVQQQLTGLEDSVDRLSNGQEDNIWAQISALLTRIAVLEQVHKAEKGKLQSLKDRLLLYQKQYTKYEQQVQALEQEGAALLQSSEVEQITAKLDTINAFSVRMSDPQISPFEKGVLKSFSQRVKGMQEQLETARQQLTESTQKVEALERSLEALKTSAKDLLGSRDLLAVEDYASVEEARGQYRKLGGEPAKDPTQGLEACVDLFRTLEEFHESRRRRGGSFKGLSMQQGLLKVVPTGWFTWPPTQGIAALLNRVRDQFSPILKELSAETQQRFRETIMTLRTVYTWDPEIRDAADQFLNVLASK